MSLKEQKDIESQNSELALMILAFTSLDSCLRLICDSIQRDIKPGDPLFTTFQDAVANSYGRVFNEMRPYGRIDDKWKKFSNDKADKIHNLLTRHRNERSSHLDGSLNRIVIYPEGIAREPNGRKGDIQFEVFTQYYTYEDYPDIRDHILDLHSRLIAEVKSMLINTFKDKPYSGLLELNSFELN